MAVLGLAAGVAALVMWWPTPETGGSGRRVAATPGEIDWTRVALEMIRQGQGTGRLVAESSGFAGTFPEHPAIFRQDVARTGHAGGKVPERLTPAWTFHPVYRDGTGQLVEDSEAMILSSPLVSGGVVYGASCTLDPPENLGSIFAVELATGRLLWTFDKIDGEDIKGFFSSPALSPCGTLVIGQGLHPGTHCRLIALDARTGELKWTVKTELHIESSPAIADGVVVVGCGAIEDPRTRRPTGHPGYVLAVDVATGEVLWREDLNDPESSPVIVGERVFIGSGFNGNALAALQLRVDTGGKPRRVWKTPAPHPVTGAVTYHQGLVYAGGGNGDFVFRDPRPAGMVMALEAETGRQRWMVRMPDAVLGAIAVREGLMVVPVADGSVMGLDPATGRELWRTEVHRGSPVLADPALAGDRIFAVSRDGYLAVLRASDGALMERHFINDPDRPGPNGLCLSGPTVADGWVVVGSETGGLRAFRAKE